MMGKWRSIMQLYVTENHVVITNNFNSTWYDTYQANTINHCHLDKGLDTDCQTRGKMYVNEGVELARMCHFTSPAVKLKVLLSQVSLL